MAGDSRVSSVSPLKVNPQTPRRRPSRLAESREQAPDGVRSLSAIDVLDTRQDRCRDAVRLADVAQRRDVLGQAAAPVADPGAEEVIADPRVVCDPRHDLVDADADRFTQAGDLVDEGDPRRQEGVRDVLDHLGRSKVGDDHLAAEPVVQVGNFACVIRVARTDDDPVRIEEVLDGAALAEKLRVRDDPGPALALFQSAREDLLDGFSCPDRRRALIRDDRSRPVERGGDGPSCRSDVSKVGGARQCLRRVDRKEDDIRLRYGIRVAGREEQPTGGDTLCDQVGKARFLDSEDAGTELGDERLAHVHADDAVAHVREAGGEHEPHMSTADDGDLSGLGGSPVRETQVPRGGGVVK